jgi:hypothetical protein
MIHARGGPDDRFVVGEDADECRSASRASPSSPSSAAVTAVAGRASSCKRAVARFFVFTHGRALGPNSCLCFAKSALRRQTGIHTQPRAAQNRVSIPVGSRRRYLLLVAVALAAAVGAGAEGATNTNPQKLYSRLLTTAFPDSQLPSGFRSARSVTANPHHKH